MACKLISSLKKIPGHACGRNAVRLQLLLLTSSTRRSRIEKRGIRLLRCRMHNDVPGKIKFPAMHIIFGWFYISCAVILGRIILSVKSGFITIMLF